MIQIKEITKKYDDNVLNKVSYKFDKNKIYVIKGVSGSGKSTLLNILGGIDNDYEGEYLFEGNNVKNIAKKRKEIVKQEFAYIFQSSLLLANLTVMENLLFISNDKKLIERYAEQLKISRLLCKYPEQLSGGERQRISIIRAMLLNSSVILADEPTASLDKSSSLEIAKLFEMLRGDERIVIIATHENCFDDIADEIIYLDYGVVGDVQVKKTSEERVGDIYNLSRNEKNKNNSLKMLIPLIFKRRKKDYCITALLPMTLVIFVVLMCFSLQSNFYAESVKYCMTQYPMEVIPVMSNSYDMVLSQRYSDAKKFNLYIWQEEKYACYPLLSEEDSVLAYGDLVTRGTFPVRDNEVLISYKMAQYLHDKENMKDCIGEKLIIKDEEYIITGIVADINNDYTIDKEIYYGDVYYSEIADSRIVYIPYQTISKYGELQDTDYYMVKIEGLYEDDDLYKFVKETMMGGSISKWDEKLNQMKNMSDYVNKVIIVTFVIAAFVSIMFIKNDIEVELFYRRKELGYLQLFGIKKKTLWLQLVLERMVKNATCLLIAVAVFYIIAVFAKMALYTNMFVPSVYIFLLFTIFIGFSLISVIFPIRKFIKKSVLSLITE